MELTSLNARFAKVIVEADSVATRLAELDPTLSEELLLEANMRGLDARMEATPAHSRTFAGTTHWHNCVAALRTELQLHGWQIHDLKNCPFTLSPDRRIMLAVMTGDVETGKQLGHPSNQAEKGYVLDLAIQGELFATEDGIDLWIFLYHVEIDKNGLAKEIRAELSRPAQFENKKIIDWHERIILRAIQLGPEVEIDVIENAETIDVAVERRLAE